MAYISTIPQPPCFGRIAFDNVEDAEKHIDNNELHASYKRGIRMCQCGKYHIGNPARHFPANKGRK